MLIVSPASEAQKKHGPDPMPGLSEIPRLDEVQSPVDFFGFPIGSRHLRHDQVTAYFQFLASSSERAKLIEYGVTHGGRPLYTLAISSPENLANLDSIQKSRAKVGAGRLTESSVATKLIMFLGYCVHGDEASAINAAPIVAYHLASGNSAEMTQALDEAVFFIDPALNPDGVDRFANWVNDNRGRFASELATDREHAMPWPGGRTNYYWFDLNRDWLPLAHPESQGRARLFHQWLPHVLLDYHEMGGSSTYFFQPGVPSRNNPLTPSENLHLTRQFASRYAEAMDAAGELYFTEEVFDDFYVGKGSTYPDLNGSVGILFEQGSTRGLKLKAGTTTRHFTETIANQVRTSIASIDRLIELKQPLLEFQTNFFRESLQRGSASKTTAYILTGTVSRIAAAAALLRQHRIRCHINDQSIQVDGKVLETGQALVIPTAQPQFVLLESLMQTDQSFEENIFYDVSAWHLPSAFDLEMHRFRSDVPATWTEKKPNSQMQRRDGSDGELWNEASLLGFALSPVELDTPKWVAALMQMNVEVRVSLVPFAVPRSIESDDNSIASTSQALPEGTFLVLKSGNKDKWPAIVRKLKRLRSVNSMLVQPLTSGRNPDGPDLGSGRINVLPKCNPALIVGSGTNANSAGAIWHFLDHRLEQPATLIDAERLGSVELSSFSCVIVPAGGYESWGKREVGALEEYLQKGGTIVATESAIGWFGRNGLVRLRAARGGTTDGPETYDGSEPPKSDDDRQVGRDLSAETKARDKSPPQPLRFADAREANALETVAGAFFMVQIDSTHPLGFGFPDESVPVFRDSTTVYAQPANPLQVAGRYDDVIAGYVSQKNRELILGSPAVWVQPMGRGRLILIADHPTFRGYVRSSERFLTNAILLGPVVTIPSAPRE